jgi:hypothetical protein
MATRGDTASEGARGVALGRCLGWAPGGWLYAARGGDGAVQLIDEAAAAPPGFGPVEVVGPWSLRRGPRPRGGRLDAALAAGPLPLGAALALARAALRLPAPPAWAPCFFFGEDGLVRATFAEPEIAADAPADAPDRAQAAAVALCAGLAGVAPDAAEAWPAAAPAPEEWRLEAAGRLWAALPEPELYQLVAAALAVDPAARPSIIALDEALAAAAAAWPCPPALAALPLPAAAARGPMEGRALADEDLRGPPDLGDSELEGPTARAPAAFLDELGPEPSTHFVRMAGPAAAPPEATGPTAPRTTPARAPRVEPRPPRGGTGVVAGAAIVGLLAVLGAAALAWRFAGPALTAPPAAAPPVAPTAAAPPSALAEDEPPPPDLPPPPDAPLPPEPVSPAPAPAAAEPARDDGPRLAPRRATEAEPAPRPAEAPAPAPQPAPEPPPADRRAGRGQTGRVVVTGDATTVRLMSGSSALPPGGSVPAGSYEVKASFAGGPLEAAGTVTVVAGETVTLSCRAGLKRCTAR